MSSNNIFNPSKLLLNESLYNITLNSSNISSNNGLINSTIDELLKSIFSDPENNYQRKKVMKNTLVIACYSLIIIISLFGNLLVCYVIFSRHRLRSKTTNILIANLTISDLLLTTFNVPNTTARLLLDNWPFGTLLCKLGPFIQAQSVYVSTLTMTIIAIDRYQVLVGVMGKRLTTSIPTFIIILFIWVSSGILSIPHAIFNQVVEYFTFKLIRCKAVYPNPIDLYPKLITVLTFTTQYMIPLLITSFCYTRIGIHIWRREGIGAMTEQQISNHIQSKRRTIKMLIIVVVIFAICWAPLEIYHIIADFGLGHYSSTTFLICHWIAMSSVCYNPFVYFWLNKHYNERAKYLFKACLRIRCRKSNKRIIKNESSDNQLRIELHNSQRLKRANAFKVSKNNKSNSLCKSACVRASTSTNSSSHNNDCCVISENNKVQKYKKSRTSDETSMV